MRCSGINSQYAKDSFNDCKRDVENILELNNYFAQYLLGFLDVIYYSLTKLLVHFWTDRRVKNMSVEGIV